MNKELKEGRPRCAIGVMLQHFVRHELDGAGIGGMHGRNAGVLLASSLFLA